MAKLPKSTKIKRSHFRTDAEFIEALKAAGKSKQADKYAARKQTR